MAKINLKKISSGQRFAYLTLMPLLLGIILAAISVYAVWGIFYFIHYLKDYSFVVFDVAAYLLYIIAVITFFVRLPKIFAGYLKGKHVGTLFLVLYITYSAGLVVTGYIFSLIASSQNYAIAWYFPLPLIIAVVVDLIVIKSAMFRLSKKEAKWLEKLAKKARGEEVEEIKVKKPKKTRKRKPRKKRKR